jgi:23S rRNA pseudouridine1911/1915/1917 synthase
VTLLERLRELFPTASRRSVKQWLERGRVEVNGRPVREGATVVAAADRVTLGHRRAVPFPTALRLVYEDADLLVIDKPAGLLTVATERGTARTAYRFIWEYLQGQRPPRRPFIVHRLDRETSGLLVFAKSVQAKRALQAQFEAREVERGYLAIVEGSLNDDEGRLESRLVEDRGLRVRPDPRGRIAVTRYRVRQRRRDASVLDLSLETGRRHQIRVQLAERGHPILGDRQHGSRQNPFGRLCLHATRLGFAHPRTGAPMRFESTVPAGWL